MVIARLLSRLDILIGDGVVGDEEEGGGASFLAVLRVVQSGLTGVLAVTPTVARLGMTFCSCAFLLPLLLLLLRPALAAPVHALVVVAPVEAILLKPGWFVSYVPAAMA